MPDLAPPTAIPSNAPANDGTPIGSDLPDYLPVAPIELAPVTVATLLDVPKVAPDTTAPGVYDGNGVMTAYVDETGALVPIVEADFATVPLADLPDLAGRYLTQELTPKAQDMPEATP